MYKRRVRVLFVATAPGGDAWTAAAYAWALGSDWLEPRCTARATPDAAGGDGGAGAPGDDGPPRRVAWGEGALRWADLVVVTGVPRPGWKTQTPTRHWDPGARTGRCRCDFFRERVAGMIGGLRLLARGEPPRGRGG